MLNWLVARICNKSQTSNTIFKVNEGIEMTTLSNIGLNIDNRKYIIKEV